MGDCGEKKCCKNASTKKKAEVIKVITRIQLGSGFFLTYFKIIFTKCYKKNYLNAI